MISGTNACQFRDMKISRELAKVIAAKFINLGLSELVDTVAASFKSHMLLNSRCAVIWFESAQNQR